MKAFRANPLNIIHWLLYMALTISLVFLFYFLKEVLKNKPQVKLHQEYSANALTASITPTLSL